MQTSGNSPLKIPVSLYFHVPFCKKKCGYCHFFVVPENPDFVAAYMEALELEWQRQEHELSDKEIATIYFGGGTPSLLGPERIGKILDWTRSLSWKSKEIEVTLEANPEGIDKAGIEGFKNEGINRVSIGIQSLDDSILHTLTRTHDAKKAMDAVHLVKSAGIDNISIDLMYDLPGQSMAQWQNTLQRALALPVTHMSLYNLVFEPHTAFYKNKEKLKVLLPDEEVSLRMYQEAVRQCRLAGFAQYEISAFQRGGHISQHNTGYWLGRPFLGFGPSAFSYWNGMRFSNAANLSKYTSSLKRGESPVDFQEELAFRDRIRELLAINLRLLEGVDLNIFQERHGQLEEETLKTLETLASQGFLSQDRGRVMLTERGILFYDTLATEIV